MRKSNEMKVETRAINILTDDKILSIPRGIKHMASNVCLIYHEGVKVPYIQCLNPIPQFRPSYQQKLTVECEEKYQQ